MLFFYHGEEESVVDVNQFYQEITTIPFDFLQIKSNRI